MKLFLLISLISCHLLHYAVNEELPVGTLIGNFCDQVPINCSKMTEVIFGNPYLSVSLSGEIRVTDRIDYDGGCLGFADGSIREWIYLAGPDVVEKIKLVVKVNNINDNRPLFCAYCILVRTKEITKRLKIYVPKPIDKDATADTAYELFGTDVFELAEDGEHIVLKARVNSSTAPELVRVTATEMEQIDNLSYMDIHFELDPNNPPVERFYIVKVGQSADSVFTFADKDWKYTVVNNTNYVVSGDAVVRTNGGRPDMENELIVKGSKNGSTIYFSLRLISTTPPPPLVIKLSGDSFFEVNPNSHTMGTLTVSAKAKCWVNSEVAGLVSKGELSFNFVLHNYSQIDAIAFVEIKCVPIRENNCPYDWHSSEDEAAVVKATIVGKRAKSEFQNISIDEPMEITRLVYIGGSAGLLALGYDSVLYSAYTFRSGDLEDLKTHNTSVSKYPYKSKGWFPVGAPTIPITGFVTFVDANNHAPEFTHSSCGTLAKKNAGKEMQFEVKAHDPDTGDNGRITYSIVSILEANRAQPCTENLFEINNSSGLIRSTGDLPNSTCYFLTVRAADSGSPSLSAEMRCVVKVRDLPLFDYHFIGEPVRAIRTGSVQTGCRIENEANLSFALVSGVNFAILGNSSDYFHVDKSNGDIYFLAVPGEQKLVVQATSPKYSQFRYSFTILFKNSSSNDTKPKCTPVKTGGEDRVRRKMEIIFGVVGSILLISTLFGIGVFVRRNLSRSSPRQSSPHKKNVEIELGSYEDSETESPTEDSPEAGEGDAKL